MRIHQRSEAGRLLLDLQPAPAELTAAARARPGLDPRGPREVFIELPPGVGGHEDLHPDLLALVSLLVVAPYVDSHLDLSTPVSRELAGAVSEHLGFELGPVDADLAPREVPTGSTVTALAFSGGVDSCAASLMLPEDTIHCFLRRAGGRSWRPARYRPEAALASVRAVERAGRPAWASRSNLEFVRRPAGYPVDWSNAAPAVLTAATRPVSALALGVILEATYSLSKAGYRSVPGGRALRRWAPVFAAVGLPLALPLASVSEVVTARMMLEEGAHLQPQSCVRGLPGRPCRACVKCFRKGPDRQRVGWADAEFLGDLARPDVPGGARTAPRRPDAL
ncbi:DUF6395 domain-containing protein [Ornithinimicrobium sp. Y1694]|uniref:DUF6395 domain-containing protein n=1 Tax=Ornithinimicrobium sp. Y1694 TaxID=3418590 RepID=UPI003CF047EE